MRKLAIFLIVFLLGFTGYCKSGEIAIQEVTQDSDEKVKLATKAFDEFFGHLRTELVKAIQKHQVNGAVGVCKEIAPALAEDYSKKYNMRIYRVSDKYRNPRNAPTEDELQVLNYWRERMNNKLEIKPVFYKVGDKTKVMRPVTTFADLCLQCHGAVESMDPKVVEAINREYPGDKATGYKLNELRGAFVAEF